MKTFEKTVRAMTGKEIVMAMINGLKKEHVTIDMMEFGSTDRGICYGCAATNTICEISGVVFNPINILGRNRRAKAVESGRQFLYDFENAIDFLRLGAVGLYNHRARRLGIAILPKLEKKLPELGTHNWRENLHYYEEYANTLN